jgi:hypothetical protein
MGDCGNGGSSGDTNGEPFSGSLEAHQKCSAVRDNYGGVSFLQERRGPFFFI